jgi:hypothetical protein
MLETIFIIFLIISIILYKYKNKAPIKNVDAFDNNSYIVNDLPDAQEASNTLAKIMIIINKLVNTIISNYDNNISISIDDKKYVKYIRVIKERLPYVKISENPTNSKYTSYSVNKGEELVLCIRDKKKYKIQPLNELLYVTIHEIAHIGSPEIGHTKLFHEINRYLLTKAIEYNLYKYIDYNIENKDYCGMVLTSTIINN